MKNDLLISEEGIVHFFVTNCGFMAMSRIHQPGIGEGEKFAVDAVEQGVQIAGRKIGPANAFKEQHISRNEKFICFGQQTNTAIGMSGSSNYFQNRIPETDFITTIIKGIRSFNFIDTKSEHIAVSGGIPEEAGSIRMNEYGDIVFFRNIIIYYNNYVCIIF